MSQDDFPAEDMQERRALWAYGTPLFAVIKSVAHQMAEQHVAPNRPYVDPNFYLDDAWNAIRDDLAAARLQAAGLENECVSCTPVLIDQFFWIGAKVFRTHNIARSGSTEYIQIKVIGPRGAKTSTAVLNSVESKEAIQSRRPSGGRPNMQKPAKAIISEKLRSGELSRFANRTEQACEIRVLLTKNESNRQKHDFPGLKTTTIKRWIGEVQSELSRSNKKSHSA